MSETEILSEIGRIARKELGIDREVARGDHLCRDLGLDSLQVIELVVAIEDRFRLPLPPADNVSSQTVGDLVQLIHRAQAAR